MDCAINLKTGEMVNAFKVFFDASYQTPYEDLWEAPQDSISNWEEIKNLPDLKEQIRVHYVKESEYDKNGINIFRSPSFSLYPNSKAKFVLESPLHKALKNWLFEKIKKGDLTIEISKQNKIKLSDLKIDWNRFSIEFSDNGYKKIRADICLPFIEKDELLGFGIVIEIQLSSQSDETEYKRTLQRILDGYSVIWLYRNHFTLTEDSFQLLKNTINYTSFNSYKEFLIQIDEKFKNNIIVTVQNQCRLIDDKIYSLIQKYNNVIEFDQLIHKINNPPNCIKCNGTMLIKQSKNNQWFWACRNYPTCKSTKSFSLMSYVNKTL